mmetsp:Transcript_4054/g.8725  ORF Transcript_4054/g.8725 Transcript_4054/m.8725 type:complete len:514 (-) Transcript_4054:501-2042(-)
MSTPTLSFRDDSTQCAICLTDFDEQESSKLDKDVVITLGCGHKYHLDCIIQQIEAGSKTAKNDDQRLLFNSCQCAKCGGIFREDDHPALPKNLIRSTDKVRSKVNALIDELNLLDVKGKEDKQPSRETLYREATHKNAFYLCSHCQNPYFGGTIECADAFRAPSNSPVPESRLCPACTPESQTICQNPPEHGYYLKWKCRYCCQPATYLCYGNVHFCNDCHGKNSKQLQGGPVLLKAIPCPGGNSCPHPKPDSNSLFHKNGATQDCEQVYSCAWCESISDDATVDVWTIDIETGSRNFVVNPSGQDGLRGWKIRNPGRSWEVEQQDQGQPPLFPTPILRRAEDEVDQQRQRIPTNFVSSFRPCTMEQRIDLSKVLRLDKQRTTRSNEAIASPVVRVEVSARYIGRNDCPSIFGMKATLSDTTGPGSDVVERLLTGVLETSRGVYWERASLVFELGTLEEISRRYLHGPVVTVTVIGKDLQYWAGYYGSKVADINVRVLGRTSEEVDALLSPDE